MPHRPLRGFVGQFKLWQGEVLSNIVEHHLTRDTGNSIVLL